MMIWNFEFYGKWEIDWLWNIHIALKLHVIMCDCNRKYLCGHKCTTHTHSFTLGRGEASRVESLYTKLNIIIFLLFFFSLEFSFGINLCYVSFRFVLDVGDLSIIKYDINKCFCTRVCVRLWGNFTAIHPPFFLIKSDRFFDDYYFIWKCIRCIIRVRHCVTLYDGFFLFLSRRYNNLSSSITNKIKYVI